MPSLQRFIDRLHQWAESGRAGPVSALWTFCQSAALPIPSDALLIALGLADPRRAPALAFWSAGGAIAGGAVAYLIGALAFHTIGLPIINWFEGGPGQLAILERSFASSGWIIIAMGSLPFISSKLTSIVAGAFGYPFGIFIVVLALTRGTRFVLVGALIRVAGPQILEWLATKTSRNKASKKPPRQQS